MLPCQTPSTDGSGRLLYAAALLFHAACAASVHNMTDPGTRASRFSFGQLVLLDCAPPSTVDPALFWHAASVASLKGIPTPPLLSLIDPVVRAEFFADGPMFYYLHFSTDGAAPPRFDGFHNCPSPTRAADQLQISLMLLRNPATLAVIRTVYARGSAVSALLNSEFLSKERVRNDNGTWVEVLTVDIENVARDSMFGDLDTGPLEWADLRADVRLVIVRGFSHAHGTSNDDDLCALAYS